MDCDLEARMVDASRIVVTEDNTYKEENRDIFGDTRASVGEAIVNGRASDVPPIVVFHCPYDNLSAAIDEYTRYILIRYNEGVSEEDKRGIKEIFENRLLLCYNGHRRLEEFQKAGAQISAYVINSQEQFLKIPEEERRFPKGILDRCSYKEELDEVIDSNYELSYLSMLRDAINLMKGLIKTIKCA